MAGCAFNRPLANNNKSPAAALPQYAFSLFFFIFVNRLKVLYLVDVIIVYVFSTKIFWFGQQYMGQQAKADQHLVDQSFIII